MKEAWLIYADREEIPAVSKLLNYRYYIYEMSYNEEDRIIEQLVGEWLEKQ